MHSYEKRFTNAEGAYEIWQIRTDGLQRKVDENHHDYVAWLELGNTPAEVPYVAPPEPGPQPPSLESRVQAVEDALLMII